MKFKIEVETDGCSCGCSCNGGVSVTVAPGGAVVTTTNANVSNVLNSDNNMYVGKVFDFYLESGEKAQYMVQKEVDNGWLCVLVDCLPKKYRYNPTNTNRGGYAASELREKMNGEILNLFPADLRSRMIPFASGDLLRLPTEKEIFGRNEYGAREPDDVKQWEPMKKRRNRMAFRGLDEELEWYWLENAMKDSASTFANVSYGGNADYDAASNSNGVRPAFILRKS